MPVNKLFFNSGVLLIDLQKWKEKKILPRLVHFMSKHNKSLRFADQDALNAILYDDWFPLNPTWNMHLFFFLASQRCNYDQIKLKKALKNPAIVHFTTKEKPWFYLTQHPFKSEYYKYLEMTEWSDYCPPDQSVFAYFKNKYNILHRRIKPLFEKEFILFKKRLNNLLNKYLFN